MGSTSLASAELVHDGISNSWVKSNGERTVINIYASDASRSDKNTKQRRRKVT